jgi:hypothetical protein
MTYRWSVWRVKVVSISPPSHEAGKRFMTMIEEEDITVFCRIDLIQLQLTEDGGRSSGTRYEV